MLKDQRITNPGQLAIDRPSGKFQSFLRKHYGLSRNIPQVNLKLGCQSVKGRVLTYKNPGNHKFS